jgi:hypothetical protein
VTPARWLGAALFSVFRAALPAGLALASGGAAQRNRKSGAARLVRVCLDPVFNLNENRATITITGVDLCFLRTGFQNPARAILEFN